MRPRIVGDDEPHTRFRRQLRIDKIQHVEAANTVDERVRLVLVEFHAIGCRPTGLGRCERPLGIRRPARDGLHFPVRLKQRLLQPVGLLRTRFVVRERDCIDRPTRSMARMHLSERRRRSEVNVGQCLVARPDRHVALVRFFDDFEPFHGRLARGYGPAGAHFGQFLQHTVDLFCISGQAVRRAIRQLPFAINARDRHGAVGVGDSQRIDTLGVKAQENGWRVSRTGLQTPDQRDDDQLR